MKNVDDVIKELLDCLEAAYALKFIGKNENQDLGSLVDGICEKFMWGIEKSN
jgi:hypothetical protein